MDTDTIVRTADVSVRVMRLQPGSATDWHHHSAVDDFFVGLKGTIRVEMRGKTAVTLSPGETTRIPVGLIHRVCNSGEGEAEYLLVQGIGPYDFIRED